MKLTKEQLIQNAEAMIAVANGKPVQFYHTPELAWKDYEGHIESSAIGSIPFRPKPAPKTRPWNRPEDVPLNCWLTIDRENARLVLAVMPDGVRVAGRGCDSAFFSWRELQPQFKWSVDRASWHRCEVEVPE